MKITILCTVAGAAAGAFLMWLLPKAPEDSGNHSAPAASIRLSEDNQKLTARVQSLEKELAAAKQEKPGQAAEVAGGDAKPQVFTTQFDDGKIEEMMKQHAERDANREADKLALRLKLTPEQKKSLKKFLLAAKESERAGFRAMMKNGGKADPVKPGQSEEEFLKSMLTPEQQAEYARSQEEQRTARAEEYAQRKVRKLHEELSLSEEQKDKLFQAYAQQKLAASDPAKKPESPGDVIGAAVGGAISFSSISVGGDSGPVEFEFDGLEGLTTGGSDLPRETMQTILTPEQLAVYDQRKTEEQERMKTMIQSGAPAAISELKIETK